MAVFAPQGGVERRAIRPLNEARMRARWKLEQLLSKVERSQGKTSLTAFTKFQEAMRGTVLSGLFLILGTDPFGVIHAMGWSGLGTSHEARHVVVRDFNRVDSRFAGSNTLHDLRLKGRGRLSWRPLSFRMSPVGHCNGNPCPLECRDQGKMG
jgi:hypothetical protein